MKRRKMWLWRKIFAVFGLVVCAFWFILAVEVLPADFKPPAFWGTGVDSAKWFITLAGGTHWDSTAGAARTDCARYDTTITGLSNDTAYTLTCMIWDADSGRSWVFYWPIFYSGTGSGDNAVRYYAVDTSGTDVAIMDVKITMNTIEGVYDASGHTNANGYKDFTAPTDEMVFLGRKLGYYFPYDTNDISGSLTDTLIGYDIPIAGADDPDLCRVYGYVYTPEGKSNKRIKVTFTVSGEAVHNDCNATAFIAEPVTDWTRTHADSLSFFFKDLLPSGCLLKANGDSLQYKITAELDGNKIRETYIWVPQAESFEVVW